MGISAGPRGGRFAAGLDLAAVIPVRAAMTLHAPFVVYAGVQTLARAGLIECVPLPWS